MRGRASRPVCIPALVFQNGVVDTEQSGKSVWIHQLQKDIRLMLHIPKAECVYNLQLYRSKPTELVYPHNNELSPSVYYPSLLEE